MLAHTTQQLLIGLGVSVTSMVVFAGGIFLILVFRRRYLRRDDKYLKRVEWATAMHAPGPGPGPIDMTRSVAWSHRNGFRSPEGGGPRGGSSLAHSPHDPTLRPLHGQNDPFFHRERQAQYGYSHSGSPSHSYSDRSGNIAIVPFRESNLPPANASYDVDGRIRVPNGHVRRGPDAGGLREEFPGSRPHRTWRNPVDSSLGFDDELFDLAAGRRSPVRRDFNRDVPNWRRDSDNPWVENTGHSSSADTSTEMAPLQGRRGPPGAPPTGNNFNFSRDRRSPERLPRIAEPWMRNHWDSSHLQEVYY